MLEARKINRLDGARRDAGLKGAPSGGVTGIEPLVHYATSFDHASASSAHPSCEDGDSHPTTQARSVERACKAWKFWHNLPDCEVEHGGGRTALARGRHDQVERNRVFLRHTDGCLPARPRTQLKTQVVSHAGRRSGCQSWCEAVGGQCSRVTEIERPENERHQAVLVRDEAGLLAHGERVLACVTPIWTGEKR